jgi:hypothetical protein
MKKKTIVQAHKRNFNILTLAFKNGDVALMECYDKQLDEMVAVICAVSLVQGEYQFTPFARFFNGNPYEILKSPMELDEEQD